MKIYCHCSTCEQKVDLASNAKTRLELANLWGRTFQIKCSHCSRQSLIDVNGVIAEPRLKKVPIITIISGGLIGILAGPLGILIGLGAGGVSGGAVRYKESQQVKQFNNHFLN